MADLAAVYTKAAEIIEERGWAQTYSYRSSAPVDLPRALLLAERAVGYSAASTAPGELLGVHQGKPPSALSRELDQDQALSLLRWAAEHVEVLEQAWADAQPKPRNKLLTPQESLG